jgi:hypothetical protein
MNGRCGYGTVASHATALHGKTPGPALGITLSYGHPVICNTVMEVMINRRRLQVHIRPGLPMRCLTKSISPV